MSDEEKPPEKPEIPKEQLEQEKKKELEAKRKELEENRKKLIAKAEGLEASKQYAEAIQTYDQLARISEELNEKDRVKIFEEKAKDMRKLDTELRKSAEIESQKDQFEMQKDKAIEEGEVFLQEGKFNEAINKFKEVIQVAEKLGDKDIVEEYKTRVQEISSQKSELIRKFEQEKKVKKLEVERRGILRKAEEAVANEDYLVASEQYEQASALSEVMGQPERAEIFMSRSKEMLEIFEDIKKREEEEHARAEMEKMRIDLEDSRAKVLSNAEIFLEKGQFSKAAASYEQAAKYSLDLGEKEVATGFTAQARDIREKEPELKKEFQEEKRRKKRRKERAKLIKLADKFLEKEEYLEASDMFIRCAEKSKDAGERDAAKEFQQRADECRVKEKEKRDELLDRVAKALRAVITLRLMEPEIASDVFSWEELTCVIKAWDVGAAVITFKEGEATITRGEAAKFDAKIEGTSESLMKYCSGRYHHSRWARYFGWIRTTGNNNELKKFEKVLKLPPLEREVEKLYNFSAISFAACSGLLAIWILFLQPLVAIQFIESVKMLLAGETGFIHALGGIDSLLGPDTGNLIRSLYDFIQGWLVILIIYLPGMFILLAFIPYYLFKRVRFEGVKKEKTKEKKRVIRRAIVAQAEKAYKSGRFIDASRLWQKAALLSVELADEDRAAEYAVRAHALKGKTAELKKQWKIEQKKELEAKMKKELEARRGTLEAERKKILQEAVTAEDDGRLLDASRHYKLASQLSLEIGEKEKAREYSEKSKESKRREGDLRRRSKVEKDRIRAAERIDQFQGQLKEALEIAEVAVGEERWIDASKYYEIAAKYATEMGETDRAKAFKGKADEYGKRATIADKKEKLESDRRQAIIDAEAAAADGNYKQAAKLYLEAARLSQEMGEKEIAEGFKATAAELQTRK
ncbi:MAG: hypothetical protein EAX96_14465 [Candidatus Lokiarchaeota archaeon]|nr:hypothetical protein [Candidatus Lokiarchaeota archaeon]